MRARAKLKASPLWQCLSRHFDAFLEGYEERYQSRYGFLRPIIPEVVNIPQPRDDCGDLEQGVRVFRARAPPKPDEWVIEPCYDDPVPCLPRRIPLSG